MRIVAHFIRKFLPLTYTFVKNQITNHVEYEPHIFFKELITPEIHANDVIKNFNTYNIGEMNNKYEKLLYDKFRVLCSSDITNIERKLNDIKPNILHFHFGTDAGMYYKIIKYSNIPSVVSFYGYDCSSFPVSYFGFGKRFLNNRVFRNATAIFAMSEDMKRDLVKIGCPENKIIIHYYGTDVKRFSYIPRIEKNINRIKLLIISNLSEYKGHRFLFKTLKKLVEDGIDNFHLKVIGSGIQENDLKKVVCESGLSNYVTFAGAVKYASKEMIGELENADIFVHPSVTYNGVKEGIPGAIIEAMASGLPVVSTFHAGIPYVIEKNKTGFIVDEWDVKAFADILNRLFVNKELRFNIGKAAREYAMNFLDLEQKQIELETIYDSLIEKYKRI